MLSRRFSFMLSDLCRSSTFPWSSPSPSAGPTTESLCHISSVTFLCNVPQRPNQSSLVHLTQRCVPRAQDLFSSVLTCFTVCSAQICYNLRLWTVVVIYLHAFAFIPVLEKSKVTSWRDGEMKIICGHTLWISRFSWLDESGFSLCSVQA